LGTEGLGSLARGGKSSEMLVVQEARFELVVLVGSLRSKSSTE